MASQSCSTPRYAIKQPHDLSPRIQWLRDYYFQGVERKWNNEFTGFTTGTPWDIQYQEGSYYIVPETYTFFSTFTGAFQQASHPVALPEDFWKWSLPERHAWFVKEVMVYYLPHEILPGDLIAGGRSYAENGGSALQVNMIDADVLLDTQKNPDAYHHLLIRVTGYNAYFTSIGRELQNEIIARESHRM